MQLQELPKGKGARLRKGALVVRRLCRRRLLVLTLGTLAISKLLLFNLSLFGCTLFGPSGAHSFRIVLPTHRANRGFEEERQRAKTLRSVPVQPIGGKSRGVFDLDSPPLGCFVGDLTSCASDMIMMIGSKGFATPGAFHFLEGFPR